MSNLHTSITALGILPNLSLFTVLLDKAFLKAALPLTNVRENDSLNLNRRYVIVSFCNRSVLVLNQR